MMQIISRVRVALGGLGRSAFGFAFVAAAAAGWAAPATASAEDHYVLTVDIANPGNVVIAATGEHSLVEDWETNGVFGVSLYGLFDADFDPEGDGLADDGNVSILSMNLTAGESDVYDFAYVGYGNLSDRDLNLWGAGSDHYFTVEGPAFFGDMTVDFSGALLSAGTVGNVVAGDSLGGSGKTIGQFLVIDSSVVAVPSPTAAFGGLLTMLVLGVGRHRRN